MNPLQHASPRWALALALFVCTAAHAESDVWRDLLHQMQFADVNRAQLAFSCKNDARYKADPRLKGACTKPVPDRLIEDAALPYLKKHVPAPLAKQAVVHFSSSTSQSIRKKMTAELASGKREQLTPAELAFMEKENASEIGKSVINFASDPDQGRAVSRAILDY